MSEKTIRVKKEENRLLVYYSPSINFDEVVRNIAYGTLIKGTFWVTQDNLVEVNEEEEYIFAFGLQVQKVHITSLIRKYLILKILYM